MVKYKCSECNRTYQKESSYTQHLESCQSSEKFGLEAFPPFKIYKSAFRQFLIIYILDNLRYNDVDGLFFDESTNIQNLLDYIHQKIGCI